MQRPGVVFQCDVAAVARPDAGQYPRFVVPRTLVGLVVCAGLVVGMSVTTVPGWAIVAVLIATLVLLVPLGVRRYRMERKLARAIWRKLTTR